MVKRVLTDDVLYNNVKHCAKRIENGFFNIFIIWGATRTGKSTLVFQMAHDLAQLLNVSFNAADNVWFSSKDILEAGKKGIRRGIYVLDEASFDGKGIDWQNKDQQNLIKLFNTAAKYNQTYFLLLPNVEELKSNFIRDAHSMGLQIGYNTITLERGYFRMYSKKQFLYKYWKLANKQYVEAEDATFSYQGKFSADLSFFDEDAYNKKKDDAIKQLGEEKEEEKTETKSKLAKKHKEARVNAFIKVIEKKLYRTWKEAATDFGFTDTEVRRIIDDYPDLKYIFDTY